MTMLSLLLDISLIGLLAAGIFYAIKLTRQLSEMRASRTEMQRFIVDFNATVGRAEAGIKGLKTAARSSGDDLEKLIERAHGLRDELHFLIESADQIANRLTAMGTFVARASGSNEAEPEKKTTSVQSEKPAMTASVTEIPTTASAAERELLRVLSKLG